MGDSKKAKLPNQKRFKPEKKAAELTPEQKAAALAAQELALAEAKAEAARVELYGKSVQNMSHRQLRTELVKTTRREHTKIGKGHYEPIPGLTIAYSTVLLHVLDNTKTPTNVFETDNNGKPTRVGRLDQINQLGRLAHYLR